MQPLAQQFGKEMVITVPAPLVVQGDDEEVGVFEIFQGLLSGNRGGGIMISPENGIT